jgi:hypothetical protein
MRSGKYARLPSLSLQHTGWLLSQRTVAAKGSWGPGVVLASRGLNSWCSALAVVAKNMAAFSYASEEGALQAMVRSSRLWGSGTTITLPPVLVWQSAG